MLHNLRISAKGRIPEKSGCLLIKQDACFGSPITANIIKNSCSIEKEQKKSMENYLTEAEGSA